MEAAYKALLLRWHPDRNGNSDIANKVTAQINVLFSEAAKAVEHGAWALFNKVEVKAGSKTLHVAYRKKAAVAEGDMLIGRQHVTMLSSPGAKDLARHAETIIAMLPAAPSKAKERVNQRLPHLTHLELKAGDRYGYAFHLPGNMIRLADIIAKRGPLDPKHVAWIITRLMDTACYLDHIETVHLGIDVDHVFVSPDEHEVLLAGWEFASERRKKPLAGTPLAGKILGSALKDRPTDRRHTLTMIRALARAVLGDVSGSSFGMRKDIAPSLARWLKSAPARIAQQDFASWEACREESFGPRRWTPLSITQSDIYGA